MNSMRFSLSLLTGAVMLSSPLAAFAISSDGLPPPPSPRGYNIGAGTQDTGTRSVTTVPTPSVDEMDIVTEDNLDEILEGVEDMPSMYPDGKGFGPIYPGMGGGISVDASVTKTVTPDFVALNAYCEVGPLASRTEVKTALADMYAKVKAAVGTSGTVRKNGGVGVYPYFDPAAGRQTDEFNGSISIFVRLTNVRSGQTVFDAVEEQGCNVNWDVRLVDTQAHESAQLDELIRRLGTRKTIFEKLLKRSLSTIIGASISTWADGYSTYDPETNTVEATTTLSVIYDASTAE